MQKYRPVFLKATRLETCLTEKICVLVQFHADMSCNVVGCEFKASESTVY